MLITWITCKVSNAVTPNLTVHHINMFCRRGKIKVNYLTFHHLQSPGPEVIKHFSCSTQQSMKFFLLIYVKMPTTVGILTYMSKKNSIIGLSEPVKS